VAVGRREKKIRQESLRGDGEGEPNLAERPEAYRKGGRGGTSRNRKRQLDTDSAYHCTNQTGKKAKRFAAKPTVEALDFKAGKKLRVGSSGEAGGEGRFGVVVDGGW